MPSSTDTKFADDLASLNNQAWYDPNNPVIAARPWRAQPGGTLYFFRDGSAMAVWGGKKASYRANSPGVDLSSREVGREQLAPRGQRIEDGIALNGGIGYTF